MPKRYQKSIALKIELSFATIPVVKSSSEPKENKSELSPWSYASIGTQLAITLLLGFYAGYRLDIHYQSSPWYTLAGCFVGLTAGLYNLFKSIQDHK